jgi:hypothetical protein
MNWLLMIGPICFPEQQSTPGNISEEPVQGENLYARCSVVLWPKNGSVWCSGNSLDLYLRGCWLELRPDHKLMYLRYRLSHCRLYLNNFWLSLDGTSALVYQSQICIDMQIICANQAFFHRHKNLKEKLYNCNTDILFNQKCLSGKN